MAKVWVGFYRECMTDLNGHPISAPKEPAMLEDVLDTTSGEDHTVGAPEGATMVAIHTNAAASIKVGEGATATTANRRRGANSTEYLGIQEGHRVSAITNPD